MALAASALDFQRVRGTLAVQWRSQLFSLLDRGTRHLSFLFEPLLRSLLDKDRNKVTNPTVIELVMLLVNDVRDVIALETREPLRQTVDYLVHRLVFVQLAHGDILQRRPFFDNLTNVNSAPRDGSGFRAMARE